MMKTNPNIQKVQAALDDLGLTSQIIEMPASTRSAQEAAQAVGCQIGQIVKSLVFRGVTSQSPILALVSGANRVHEGKLGDVFGEPVEKADADFVRQTTGFSIGGVAPLGHSSPLRTVIDQDLMDYNEIWAAAGTPNAVFKLTPIDLLLMSKGDVISLK